MAFRKMAKQRTGIIEGFAERLNVLIIESGLTCSEIGERVGRERKSISGYRNGDCVPNAVVLMKMCAVLNTTPNYLLLGKDKDVKLEIPCKELNENLEGHMNITDFPEVLP